jgi:hypothetical protein
VSCTNDLALPSDYLHFFGECKDNLWLYFTLTSSFFAGMPCVVLLFVVLSFRTDEQVEGVGYTKAYIAFYSSFVALLYPISASIIVRFPVFQEVLGALFQWFWAIITLGYGRPDFDLDLRSARLGMYGVIFYVCLVAWDFMIFRVYLAPFAAGATTIESIISLIIAFITIACTVFGSIIAGFYSAIFITLKTGKGYADAFDMCVITLLGIIITGVHQFLLMTSCLSFDVATGIGTVAFIIGIREMTTTGVLSFSVFYSIDEGVRRFLISPPCDPGHLTRMCTFLILFSLGRNFLRVLDMDQKSKEIKQDWATVTQKKPGSEEAAQRWTNLMTRELRNFVASTILLILLHYYQETTRVHT